jgi:hypothetical protein
VKQTPEDLNIEVLSLQLQRDRLCMEHTRADDDATRSALMKALRSVDDKIIRRRRKIAALRNEAARVQRLARQWPLLDGVQHTR